jgi:MYXO-CTERM domain-containing protein
MTPHLISQIRVTRTVYVPDTGSHDYLRYFDSFENTSSSDQTVTAEYYGYIGSRSYTTVTATSSGDAIIDLTDLWYVTQHSSSTTTPTGFLWTDGIMVSPSTMSMASGSVSTMFTFTVPAGETRALMVFAIQNATASGAETVIDYLDDVPDAAIYGLTDQQQQQIVNWHVSGAPIISLVTEELVVEEGGEIALEVDVVDLEGDSFDVYWELTEDGFFDDGTGTTATFSAVGFDGPDTATVSVRAQDSAEERIFSFNLEVTNALPVFVSDPAVDPGLDAFRGRTWEYWLEVEDPANSDGITRDPVIITVPTKPEGMIYFGDQHFEWTPRSDGSDVGLHTVRIEADDRDGEEGEVAVQEFDIDVQDNTPPDAPIIVSPDMTTVYTTRPDLTVENAVDFDGDPLSYTYEVATAGDFTTIVARGQLFEAMGGQTTWTVNTDLMDGTRYYWRCFANDGRNDGPADDSWFDIDTSMTPEDDADASSDVPTDGIPPYPTPGDSDCGCRTVGADGAALPWAGLGLALLGLALALRRKR